MHWDTALLLGVVQGLTEFLPVSSSGHLVLSRALLPGGALASPGVLFEVVVHLGTLFAALIFLRREIGWVCLSLVGSGSTEAKRTGRRMAVMLGLATVPVVLAGFLLADSLRATFAEPGIASAGLVVTGAALLAFRRKEGRETPKSTSPALAPASPESVPRGVRDALYIGAAQAFAILPGVSRSGFTILASQRRGLTAADAARFSFLLSGPAIAAAALVEGTVALSGNPAGAAQFGVELAVGFAAAFAAGMVALRWVFHWLARQRFHHFGWYCLLAGGIGLGLSSA